MLKQRIENKAEKVPDSVTVSGQLYHRRDYEDERQPGYTKPGKLYSSAELTACGLFGLTSPSGHLFSAHLPLLPVPDPTHVSRTDAPAKLLEAASKAWARLEEIRGRVAAALEKRTKAEEAHRRAAARGNKAEFNSAIAAEMQAEQEREALAMEEAVPRRDAAAAEEAITRWCRDESLYRCGAAERPAEPAIF